VDLSAGADVRLHRNRCSAKLRNSIHHGLRFFRARTIVNRNAIPLAGSADGEFLSDTS
jgi:hypothetical protein